MGRQKPIGMGWSEGWAGKEAPGSLRGRRVGWIWAAAVPPHAHTHSRPRPSRAVCRRKPALWSGRPRPSGGGRPLHLMRFLFRAAGDGAGLQRPRSASALARRGPRLGLGPSS